MLGLSAVAVTVIVTIIANERERTQTWALFLEKTKVKFFVTFNLVLLASEGLATVQTFDVDAPLIVVPSTQGIILAEGIFFGCSLIMLGYLFIETFRFLDPGYSEDLAERKINDGIRTAVRNRFE